MPFLAFLSLQTPALTAEQTIMFNPWLTGLVILLLFTTLIASFKLILKQHESRVNEKFTLVENHNSTQDKKLLELEQRLLEVNMELKKYDTHVAVGAKETSAIHESLARVEAKVIEHTTKEEDITWVKIDGLISAVNDLKISNETAHANLHAGQTVLGGRIDAVEKKMPNGELRAMALAVGRIETGMLAVAEKADKAAQHVLDHDREATTWKQRIVALESKRRRVR
jgi:hypothetical protein